MPAPLESSFESLFSFHTQMYARHHYNLLSSLMHMQQFFLSSFWLISQQISYDPVPDTDPNFSPRSWDIYPSLTTLSRCWAYFDSAEILYHGVALTPQSRRALANVPSEVLAGLLLVRQISDLLVLV